jgi:hypothetical protein
LFGLPCALAGLRCRFEQTVGSSQYEYKSQSDINPMMLVRSRVKVNSYLDAFLRSFTVNHFELEDKIDRVSGLHPTPFFCFLCPLHCIEHHIAQALVYRYSTGL